MLLISIQHKLYFIYISTILNALLIDDRKSFRKPSRLSEITKKYTKMKLKNIPRLSCIVWCNETLRDSGTSGDSLN